MLQSRVQSTTQYNALAMLPGDWQAWDDYRERLNRYSIFDGYYHNVMYHRVMQYSESLKSQEKLYKHVRGVHNPVFRFVELYVSKVCGGMLDTQTGKQGAIPIVADNEAIYGALIALWKASRWNQKKSLYVRNGATFGDSFLKVVDDVRNQMVYMEPVDPGKVKALDTDASGRITRVVLEYMIAKPDVVVDDGETGDAVTYTEIITPEKFETFINDKAVPIHMNGRGELVSEWPNEYGFVPMVAAQHRDVGLTYGANGWYPTVHKINEINDVASIINDGARRQVQMPLVSIGQRWGDKDAGEDQSNNRVNQADKPRKDTVPVIELMQGSDIKTLAPTLNIADALSLVESIMQEIERDTPELSLHRLRDSGNLTAPGVRSAYDDAISRILEARGNYDATMVEAQKMAIAIGGMRGYDGYEGFNLMSLSSGNLEHYVKERPVIADTLSRDRKIELTLSAMSSKAPKAVYEEIGWGETEIEEILEAQDANTTSFMNQFGAPTDPTPPESPEDRVTNEGIAQINEADILDAQTALDEVA